MRVKELEKIANEESNYTITFTFYDESDSLVTPTTIRWFLSSLDGAIINSRYNVEGTPANPFAVTLSGDDLQIFNKDADFERRYLTIKATYDSSYGNDLPITSAVIFRIKNRRLIAPDLYLSVTDTVFTNDYVGGVA